MSCIDACVLNNWKSLCSQNTTDWYDEFVEIVASECTVVDPIVVKRVQRKRKDFPLLLDLSHIVCDYSNYVALESSLGLFSWLGNDLCTILSQYEILDVDLVYVPGNDQTVRVGILLQQKSSATCPQYILWFINGQIEQGFFSPVQGTHLVFGVDVRTDLTPEGIFLLERDDTTNGFELMLYAHNKIYTRQETHELFRFIVAPSDNGTSWNRWNFNFRCLPIQGSDVFVNHHLSRPILGVQRHVIPKNSAVVVDGPTHRYKNAEIGCCLESVYCKLPEQIFKPSRRSVSFSSRFLQLSNKFCEHLLKKFR